MSDIIFLHTFEEFLFVYALDDVHELRCNELHILNNFRALIVERRLVAYYKFVDSKMDITNKPIANGINEDNKFGDNACGREESLNCSRQ